MKVKFIQITYSNGALHALDVEGQVWRYESFAHDWKLLPSPEKP